MTFLNVHYLSESNERALRAETRSGATGGFELEVQPGAPYELTAEIDKLPPLPPQVPGAESSAPFELETPGPVTTCEEPR